MSFLERQGGGAAYDLLQAMPRGVQQRTESGVANAYSRAIISAADVQAGTYVAHQGIRAVQSLKAEIRAGIEADPLSSTSEEMGILRAFGYGCQQSTLRAGGAF